jgi:hypothetical protein
MDEFRTSTDKAELDVPFVHRFLSPRRRRRRR